MAIQVVFFDLGNTLVAENRWLESAQETVARLRGAGVRVGVMSNTGRWSREQLGSRLPAEFSFDLFSEDLVLLSSEVGVEKPDLGMFLLGVSHAGVSPWETLFVGETLMETLAAQQAGMQAARVDPSGRDLIALADWILAGRGAD